MGYLAFDAVKQPATHKLLQTDPVSGQMGPGEGWKMASKKQVKKHGTAERDGSSN